MIESAILKINRMLSITIEIIGHQSANSLIKLFTVQIRKY